MILDFNFPPLSQNNIERTGRKSNHRYKTLEAKKYLKNIEAVLMLNDEVIREFLSDFNKITHAIELSYLWSINHESLLTKRKNKSSRRRISLTSGDTFNFEKYTTDCIFNFLCLNDAIIIDGHVRKVPSLEKSSFRAEIKAIPLDTIPEYKDFL